MKWRKWIAALILKYLQKRHHHHQTMMLLISRHPYTPLSYVETYKNLAWDKMSLSSHPEMTRGFYKKYIASSSQKTFHPRRSICPVYFQGIASFDFHVWEKSPYKKTFLSYHPKLPIPLVLKFPTLGWDFTFLLLYREWTVHQIEQLIRCKKMNWVLYSRNPYIHADVVRHFLRFPWEWQTLATHPSFPPQEIYHDNILINRWKWRQVFKNPRLSLAFWQEELGRSSSHLTKDPYVILHNKFQFDRNLRLWATFKILSLVCHYRQKKSMKEKLRLLLFLKAKVCPDVLDAILSFV